MLDSLLQTLETAPAVWAYGFVAVAAFSEYVFPPLPGDMVVLFAVFLSARAALEPLPLLGAATAGAVLGGIVAWLVGIWLADRTRPWPRALGGVRVSNGLTAVQRGYARYGSLYLLANRFLPALRAFFFVGAGLSKMPLWRVVVFGGLSALLWNVVLIVAGFAAEDNWPLLQTWFGRYSVAVLGALVVVGMGWLFLKRARK